MEFDFDKAINEYVNQCMAAPAISGMSDDQKSDLEEKIREYLNDQLIDTVLDNLTLDQAKELQELGVNNPEFAKKIEQFASNMPFALEDTQKKIEAAVGYIKQNGQLPSGGDNSDSLP